MRIPSELVSPYVPETTSQPASQGGMAEPVGESARIESALPQSLPKDQTRASEDRAKPGDVRKEQAEGKPSQPVSNKERRKSDRRKEVRPALLDTRLTGSRRKPDGYAAIDLET
jgi:hypothetical protein